LLWPHKPVDAFSTFATLMAQKGASLTATKGYIDQSVALEVLEFMVELSALVPDFCASSNPIDIAERLSGGDEYSHGICMYGYSNYSHKGFRKHRLVAQALLSQVRARTLKQQRLPRFCFRYLKSKRQHMVLQEDSPAIWWLGRTVR